MCSNVLQAQTREKKSNKPAAWNYFLFFRAFRLLRVCISCSNGSAISTRYFTSLKCSNQSLTHSINCNNIHYILFPFEYFARYSKQQKMENGIVVFWEEKSEKKYESFNYSELVDMKINVLDLLERPKSYKIDKDAHTLISKK